MKPLNFLIPCFAFLLSAQTAPSTAPAPIPPVVPLKGKPGAPLQLFNGKDLANWAWHPLNANPPSKIDDTWSVNNGILRCAAKPTGYIRVEKEFKNFILTLEYRHLTNANGGTFICIHGDDAKVWPDAIQIQGYFAKVGDLINQNTGMTRMTTDPARTKTVNKDIVATKITNAEKPLKEWNTLIITIEDGNLNVMLNGTLVNTASNITPDSGKIGIQAEGAEMEFRKIELTPIQ